MKILDCDLFSVVEDIVSLSNCSIYKYKGWGRKREGRNWKEIGSAVVLLSSMILVVFKDRYGIVSSLSSPSQVGCKSFVHIELIQCRKNQRNILELQITFQHNVSRKRKENQFNFDLNSKEKHFILISSNGIPTKITI